jgi:hypothetical protein
MEKQVLANHIERVLKGLNETEARKHKQAGFTHAPDFWHAIERSKYIALNCGTSGAFMVERATGEIYNIKAYGQIDKNKKAKADLGNIGNVDPAFLQSKRFNYLR